MEECENFIHNKYGYCYYSLGSEPFIFNLYINPEYRRCGHSKVLLCYIIDIIRKNGYDGDIKIQAEPREDSIPIENLIKYYEKLGLTVQT